MSWKSLPYWLRGGLIGLIVAIVIYLAFFSCAKLSSVENYYCVALFYYPLMYSGLLALKTPFLSLLHGMIPFENAINKYLILSALVYFIIGAIIGLIYSKFRRKTDEMKGGET